jgi:hypothetical protein
LKILVIGMDAGLVILKDISKTKQSVLRKYLAAKEVVYLHNAVGKEDMVIMAFIANNTRKL